MRKKLFTLMTLLLTAVTGAWAADEVVVIGAQTKGQAYTVATNTHSVAGYSADDPNTGTITAASDGQTASGGSKTSKTSNIGSSLASKGHVRFTVAARETVRFYYYQTSGANKSTTFATSDFSQKESYYHAATEYIAAVKNTLYFIDFVFNDAGTYAISQTDGQSVYIAALKFTAAAIDTESPTCTMSTSSPVAATPLVATTLTVTATHYESLQWYKATASDLSDAATISGATGLTYDYTPTAEEAGKTRYIYCVATNSSATGAKTAQSGTLVVNVGNLKCATPTIEVGNFNFANKGYEVTITNAEDGSSLKVSTDGSSYTTQTSPYVTYATTTTHYYAKSVDKTGYEDSDVADENVANTFDPAKRYVAWVSQNDGNYSGYNPEADKIVVELKKTYNVVNVRYSESYTGITASHDLKNADLVICTEAVQGNKSLSNSIKTLVGVVPMIGLKFFNYTSGRWDWGAPANENKSTRYVTPVNKFYKVLSGVTFDGDNVELFDGSANENHIQTVTWSSAPTGNVDMAKVGEKIAMHASTSQKYFGLGLSCDDRANYNDNVLAIINNAAAMLISGEELDALVPTETIATASGRTYGTYVTTNALDFTLVNDDIKVYTITGLNGAGTAVEVVEKTQVPAGSPILVKVTTPGASVNVPYAATTPAALGDNCLIAGTGASISAGTGTTTRYVLSGDKFKKIGANAATVPATKAYLEITGSSAPELTFDFGDNNTGDVVTGISAIDNGQLTMDNAEVYNLNGQRVEKPTKGLYIINGKKVVIK